MNEQSIKIVKGIIIALLFCLCVFLVVRGHRNISLRGLGIQLLGLAGLLGLLGYYNKQYK
ncbi:MAG: DUF6903 family protein [Lachnospiraceae bacterium]